MVFGENECAHGVLSSILRQKRPGRPSTPVKFGIFDFFVSDFLVIFGYSLALNVLKFLGIHYYYYHHYLENVLKNKKDQHGGHIPHTNDTPWSGLRFQGSVQFENC